jgi:peptidoglycan/LPS O-acetylase OafA/YrhL
MKKNNYLLCLDSLRGLAAVIVMLYHFSATSSSLLTDNFIIMNGRRFVDFFFVLSGFIISVKYFDKIIDIKSLIKFQIRRFYRLYPLHFITLFFFILVELSKFYFEKKTGIIANNPSFSNNNFFAFVNNLFLTQSFFVPHTTFNDPSWSISLEFYIYLLFALLLIFFKKKIRILLFVILIIIFGSLIFNSGADETMDLANGLFAFIRASYCFLIGAVAYFFYKNCRSYFPFFTSYLIYIILIFYIYYLNFLSKVFLPLIFAALIVSLCINKKNILNYFFTSKLLIFLGKISYGIYMIHSIVWWIFRQFFRFILNVPTTQVNNVTVLNIAGLDILFYQILASLIVIFFSFISLKYYESFFYKK